MLRQMFRTKNLDDLMHEAEPPERSLKRALGAFDIVMLGIGAIIGAGIFATIGTAVAGDAMRPGAGPGIILSFALTAVACAFCGLCYAEFASHRPDLRERLHVFVCDPRRAGGLDHRVGPDHRVRRRQRRGRDRVGGVLPPAAATGSGGTSRPGWRWTSGPPRRRPQRSQRPAARLTLRSPWHIEAWITHPTIARHPDHLQRASPSGSSC